MTRFCNSGEGGRTEEAGHAGNDAGIEMVDAEEVCGDLGALIRRAVTRPGA